MKPETYMQKLLTFACQRLVSDIFFLPQLSHVLVKMREVDGLHTYQILQTDFVASVISYLKFTSDMNISEHRRPKVGARKFEFRQ